MKTTKIVCHSSNGSMLSLYVEHVCSDVITHRVEKALPSGWAIKEDSYPDGEVDHHLAYVGDEPIEYECGKRLYSAEEEETGNIVSCLNTCLQNKFI